MSRWGRSPEKIRLEIAHAFGQGKCPVEHFRDLTQSRGWRDGK